MTPTAEEKLAKLWTERNEERYEHNLDESFNLGFLVGLAGAFIGYAILKILVLLILI